MADLTLTREQANLIRDEIDDKVSLIETLVMLRGDGMELPTPCTWDEILRAVVAALDPPPLKVGDRVEWVRDRGCGGIFTENAAGVRWDAGLFSYHPLSDLRRVEKEKP